MTRYATTCMRNENVTFVLFLLVKILKHFASLFQLFCADLCEIIKKHISLTFFMFWHK